MKKYFSVITSLLFLGGIVLFLFSCEVAKQISDIIDTDGNTITISGTITVDSEVNVRGEPSIYIGLMDYVPAMPIKNVKWVSIDSVPLIKPYGYQVPFSFEKVPKAYYILLAFIDANNNGSYSEDEPIGLYPLNQVGLPDLKDFRVSDKSARVTILPPGKEANRAPTAPANPIPTIDATGVSVTPTLSWTEATDLDGDPIKYDVFLDTKEKPETLIASDLSHASYFVASALTPSTLYYWMIVVKDGNGGETQGEVWRFTTAASSRPQVAKPVFSKPSGTYNTNQSITITTATEGASIRYTTDGSDPKTSSTALTYTSPVSITQTTTLMAVAKKTDWDDSEVASAVYTMKVAAPYFDYAESTYNNNISVSITTATSGATIKYTTDGSTPTSNNGTTYSGSVSISATTTLKAIAYRSGWNDSEVTSAVYTLKVVKPSFSPAGGTYTEAKDITISTATAGATIIYTTDGSNPTSTYGTTGTTVTISSTTNLKAIAYKTGWSDSDINSENYTINIPDKVSAPTFSPGGGTYYANQSVTISSATAGSTIYYTDDGSDPKTSETKKQYTSAVSINKTMTLKAYATASGYIDSDVSTAIYTMKVATPTFSPAAGTYVFVQNVSMSTATSGATIKYTTDGSDPVTSGTAQVYSAPITVSNTTTIKAYGYKTDWANSSVASAKYTIDYLFNTSWGKYGTGDGYFSNPAGIAVNSSKEYVYVADYNNHRIQVFDLNGKYLNQWGTKGSKEGQFVNPAGVAIGYEEYVFVTDSGNNRVQVFDRFGNYRFTWGSYGKDNGQFYAPTGIAVDGDNNVYVADSGNHRIQKFDSKGNWLLTWGVYGTKEGYFNSPSGIGIGKEFVFVSDTGNNRIQVFDPSSGKFQGLWGSLGDKPGYFNAPIGICLDGVGYVFIADSNNNRIQKFDYKGNFITTWGTKGTDKGQFQTPYGVSVDIWGNVYVTEYNNHRVQKFSPTK